MCSWGQNKRGTENKDEIKSSTLVTSLKGDNIKNIASGDTHGFVLTTSGHAYFFRCNQP